MHNIYNITKNMRFCLSNDKKKPERNSFFKLQIFISLSFNIFNIMHLQRALSLWWRSWKERSTHIQKVGCSNLSLDKPSYKSLNWVVTAPLPYLANRFECRGFSKISEVDVPSHSGCGTPRIPGAWSLLYVQQWWRLRRSEEKDENQLINKERTLKYNAGSTHNTLSNN